MAVGATSTDFVPGAQRGAGGGSEVKRATIVGNPMYSAGAAAIAAAGVPLSGAAHDELVGLDDLNLGMDYDQIMEYFDNLKESNA